MSSLVMGAAAGSAGCAIPIAGSARLPSLAPAQRFFILDPRTKLLAALVMNILVMGIASVYITLTCAIIVAFFNASIGITRNWFIYVGVIASTTAWYLYGGMFWKTYLNALLVGSCFWIFRFAIVIWMAAFVVKSIGAGEVTAALRAIYMPKSCVTILTVVLRFIPLTGVELKAIIAALKLRGLVTGACSLFLHPFRTAEYVMVPLLASLTRVIDDLAAGGVIRGLGADAKPTSIVRLTFRWSDALVVAALGALTVWRLLG